LPIVIPGKGGLLHGQIFQGVHQKRSKPNILITYEKLTEISYLVKKNTTLFEHW